MTASSPLLFSRQSSLKLLPIELSSLLLHGPLRFQPHRRFNSDISNPPSHSQPKPQVGNLSKIPSTKPFEITPALRDLLKGGERAVPLPFNPDRDGDRRLIAAPNADGTLFPETSLFLPAPPDLPIIISPWPKYLLIFAGVLAFWGTTLAYGSNNLKYHTSVVQTLIWNMRTSPKIRRYLGEDVKMVSAWFGTPYIKGTLNTLKGYVDISFPIAGPLGTGIIFFTSIRRHEESKFEIIRWRVILQNGETIDLMDEVVPQ